MRRYSKCKGPLAGLNNRLSSRNNILSSGEREDKHSLIMADLDDFFAKKDKKKKTKKAGLSTVELVKKLEETTLREHETPNLDQIEEEVPAPAATFENDDDSEWKTVESTERKVDLSNLKLIVKDDDYSDSENYQGTNEESQTESGQNGVANPWAAVSGGGPSQPAEPSGPAKRYVAPGTRISKKTAPDLQSETYFPSLGADPIPKLVKKDGFEEVKHGKGGPRAQSSTVTPSFSTDNTYSSLLSDNTLDS